MGDNLKESLNKWMEKKANILLHLYRIAPLYLALCFIRLHIHAYSSRADMHGAGLPIGICLGVSVLLKDTLTCGQKDQTANIMIKGRPIVYPEPLP